MRQGVLSASLYLNDAKTSQAFKLECPPKNVQLKTVSKKGRGEKAVLFEMPRLLQRKLINLKSNQQ